ncbi:uncharacterized protein G2W53_042343 [Senna tora]|uniref:Uncharacterized protein n=1 Tax=Senna tora TaxID=362788 RepID=A0A834SGU7_9FABA|nr:uncharacterized protein G2W53_042343 [Senna tora]
MKARKKYEENDVDARIYGQRV